LNLQGQTSWYASPVVADLGGDGKNELIAAYYSIRVFASDGSLLSRADGGSGRVYAPHAVGDLEGDGIPEIVCGSGNSAPAAPAVYDLNGDGELEIFVQTFDHGMDVFTVPGSACNGTSWPTARGGPLRMGQPTETICDLFVSVFFSNGHYTAWHNNVPKKRMAA